MHHTEFSWKSHFRRFSASNNNREGRFISRLTAVTNNSMIFSSFFSSQRAWGGQLIARHVPNMSGRTKADKLYICRKKEIRGMVSWLSKSVKMVSPDDLPLQIEELVKLISVTGDTNSRTSSGKTICQLCVKFFPQSLNNDGCNHQVGEERFKRNGLNKR